MTRIRYISPSGAELVLGEGRLKILKVEGLEAPPFTVRVTNGALQEGSIALTASRGPRKISIDAALNLEGLDEADSQDARKSIGESLAGTDGEGTLIVNRSGRERRIGAVPTNAPCFKDKRWSETWEQLSMQFLCPMPCFTDMESQVTEVRYYASLLSIPEEGIEFPEEGIEFSTIEHSGTRTKLILNPGNHESPVQIRFTGPVANPFIRNITTDEMMRVFGVLAQGEYVEVNTEPGKRKITLFRQGIESNGLHYLDLESRFWQLKPGENLIEIGDESPGEGSEAAFEFCGRYLEA